MTVKATLSGAIVVHALPRPPPGAASPDGAADVGAPAVGPAEAAGVRVGDELLGMHDEYFPGTRRSSTSSRS